MRIQILPSAILAAATFLNASPGAAQSAEEKDAIILAPLTVTGELIDRPIEDSGVSAEIFDAQALEERAGLDSVRDVLEQTPNVSSLTGMIQAPTIRGVDGTGAAIGGNAFLAGTRARLNWQIDGRPASYNEVVFGDLNIWDLEQVEVLRGPQSTLTGRNSIAGTVVIKTNDPSFDYEVDGQIAAGNLSQRRFSGTVNIPLADNLAAVRLAGDVQSSLSPVKYTPFDGVVDPGEKRAVNVRGKVLLKPKIWLDTEVLLSATHTETTAPQSEVVILANGTRNSDFTQSPVHRNRTNSAGVEFTTVLTDEMTLDIDGSYSSFDFEREATAAGAPAFIDSRELVLEPKVLYEDGAGYSAVAGIHYYRARNDEFLQFAVPNTFDDRTDTVAAFAEGIVPILDEVDLLVGARYEREDRFREGGDIGTNVDLLLDETYDAFMPKAGLNWKPNEQTSWGVQVSRSYNAGGAGVTFPFPALFPVITYEFDSEYVWNYEIYGRQQFMNGRLRTTQNIFFSDYTDMQLPVDVTPTNVADGAFIIENFDRVQTYGAEFGVNYLATDDITLYGSLGLLWTEIASGSTTGINGNELHTAPNMTANAGIIWHYGNWRTSASARYSGSYYSDIDNRDEFRVAPFVTADAEVAYTFGSAEVFTSVKNVFNSEKPIFRLAANAASGQFGRAVLQQPRTFLAGLKVSF